MRMAKRWQATFNADGGATAVEYGLLIALLALALVITLQTLGGSLNTAFDTVSQRLGGAGEAAGSGGDNNGWGDGSGGGQGHNG